jgi:predicted Zn-dependent protease
VSWGEERFVGNELAVRYSAQTGHFFLDGAVEKDPSKLEQQRGTATLPEGGRNAVSAHVAVVGRNLAHFSSRPDLPWTFGVIENDTPQAFNAPGAYVFVTTGLLKKMTNEAQLAGVLSHEIAHVVQKDTLQKWRQAMHQQCLAARLSAAMLEHGAATGVPAASAQLARFAKYFDPNVPYDEAPPEFAVFMLDTTMQLLQFSDKESEFQADRRALELLSFAGYDAVEYEKFLGAWPQPNHPRSDDRAIKLKALRGGELSDFSHGTAKPELNKVFAPLTP